MKQERLRTFFFWLWLVFLAGAFLGCGPAKNYSEKVVRKEYLDGEVKVTRNETEGPSGQLASRVLKEGMQGEDVSALQARLRLAGFVTYPFTPGVFDQFTKKAVIECQKGTAPYLKEILKSGPQLVMEPTGVAGPDFCRYLIRKTGYWAKLITYQVKPNDNLWLISHQYGLSLRALMILNNFEEKNPRLQIGQKIFIIIHPAPDQEKIYQILPGDTLASIAEKNNLAKEIIIQANCLSDNQVLKVGDYLYLPAKPE